jgi:hypothetical protein
MRYMILVRATPQSESGALPDDALIAAMAQYHQQLAAAGVLLDASGLQPSAHGWRVRYRDGRRSEVIDGPFAETKELVAGYTIVQVRSRDEALEWSRRFPAPFLDGTCEIEVRRMYELEDFEPSEAVERLRELGVDGAPGLGAARRSG